MTRLQSALADQRKRSGMSQQNVAERIGAGRTTIVAIDSGNIGRVAFGTICSYADELGMSVELVKPRELERMERRLARAQQARLDAERKSKHLLIALNLDRKRVADARRQVDLWERGETCSPFYIERWRAILDGKISDIAKRLAAAAQSEWASALFQNSPFVGTSQP